MLAEMYVFLYPAEAEAQVQQRMRAASETLSGGGAHGWQQ